MGIFGYNSIGLYAQGSTADISIFGGYFANSGFSAIYLNGTHANVGDVAVRNLRIEGETGKYCLYATGAVRNLLVDSGNWGSAGEVICYESAKEGYAAGLPAENWVIRNCSLSIQNKAKRHGSWKKEGTRKTGEDLEHIPREKRSIIRADKLINARLENIWIRAYEIVRKQVPSDKQTAEKNDYGTVIQNMPFTEKEVLEWFTPKLITIADTAKNNYIQTEKETSVILPKNASGNIIRTTNDDGNSREYRGSGNVTNLTVQSIDSVKNPKIGDIILTKHQEGLALAVYNGTEWSYSKLQAGN